MNNNDIEKKSSSESDNQQPTYIEIARSIIGGSSLGAIIGTPWGFIGSAVGAGIVGAVAPFVVLKKDALPDNQRSKDQVDES